MIKDKRIAVVTGASSGLGKSISIKLSLNDYHVVLASRNLNRLNQIADIIKSKKGSCTVVQTDVTLPDSVHDLKKTVKELGTVSLLINNSGIGKFSKFSESTIEDWDLQLNTNLRGSYLVSRAFIKQMQENKNGSIVLINSVAGKFGYPYSAAYVSSKFGLRGFAESFRNELREFNIKIISVFPGAINSSFWDKLNTKFPKHEMLNPDDVADSIIHAINAPGITTVEEFTIRRVGGDF